MKDMMKNHEDYEDTEEAARWYAKDAARLHALKVAEVLKNEIKVNEDIYFDAVDYSMQNKENEDDVMQIVNKQIRVKDFARAHVTNLERQCKGKEGEVFGDTTKIVNRGSAVCGRDQGPHPTHACKITSGMEECKHQDEVNKGIHRNGGLSCHPAASWHSFVVGSMPANMMRTKEKAVINEEKFEDAEDLWYLSFKAKIKRAYDSGGVLVVSSKGERTELSLGIAHAFA